MPKILIVEDDKALNEAYEIILKKHGHKVATAYNGKEALEIFAKQKPDLVLLDLRMPVMDGTEFLKAVDPAKKHPKTQIIIFSNYDDHVDVEEAFKLGASRYILKAWSSPKELAKVVAETLKNK